MGCMPIFTFAHAGLAASCHSCRDASGRGARLLGAGRCRALWAAAPAVRSEFVFVFQERAQQHWYQGLSQQASAEPMKADQHLLNRWVPVAEKRVCHIAVEGNSSEGL